jgi:hypothetical protein
MDVDVDDGSQLVKRGQDYGIEVDFEDLEEDDRELIGRTLLFC